MFATLPFVPDVFSAREIARAAGVPATHVRALVDSGQIVSIDGRFVAAHDAVAAVRLLRGDGALPARQLFGGPLAGWRPPGLPFAASGVLHAAIVVVIALLTAAGAATQAERPREILPARLVFVARPGPGGGGGGGGLRQPTPPARAQVKQQRALRSPVPVRREVKSPKPSPPEARPTPPPPVTSPPAPPAEPPPAVTKPDPVPPVVAPVVSAAADPQDRAGVLTDTPAEGNSQGSGSGGGAGSGRGTGIGQGEGPGIGPGSGGGTGGGPYRPGSGVTPPSLIREVKPTYTEDARRRGIEGDVELEIVVRSDGTVGDVRLLRGLGAGLDQRAADAVRQWRFSPARRLGAPVDVMVEVAVEFRLR